MTRRNRSLRPDEAFVGLSAKAQVRCGDIENIAGVIARKRCAGLACPVDGASVVAALNGKPGGGKAVGWLLSTLSPHECALLVTRCGVRPRLIARHVREAGVRNDGLVRFLNQFAAG